MHVLNYAQTKSGKKRTLPIGHFFSVSIDQSRLIGRETFDHHHAKEMGEKEMSNKSEKTFTMKEFPVTIELYQKQQNCQWVKKCTKLWREQIFQLLHISLRVSSTSEDIIT